jgi:NAD-dependent dihydropyrimidine dehydrogenase PreA subunit
MIVETAFLVDSVAVATFALVAGASAVMTWIIMEPCIDVRDRACVDVCPVDCIYEIDDDGKSVHGVQADPGREKMLYIHPEECIDCGACEPVCPVDAIVIDEEVPEKWSDFTPYNYKLSGLTYEG